MPFWIVLIPDISALMPSRAEFLATHLYPVAELQLSQWEIGVCGICLQSFNQTEHRPVQVVGHPACVHHVFGHECIKTWLAQKESCPTCRSALVRDKKTGFIRALFEHGLKEADIPHIRAQWFDLCLAGDIPRDIKEVKILPGVQSRAAIHEVNGKYTKQGIFNLVEFLWKNVWDNIGMECSHLVAGNKTQIRLFATQNVIDNLEILARGFDRDTWFYVAYICTMAAEEQMPFLIERRSKAAPAPHFPWHLKVRYYKELREAVRHQGIYLHRAEKRSTCRSGVQSISN